jgi:hypothetical protein
VLLVGNYSEFHMVAKWATTTVNDLARHTGHTPHSVGSLQTPLRVGNAPQGIVLHGDERLRPALEHPARVLKRELRWSGVDRVSMPTGT